MRSNTLMRAARAGLAASVVALLSGCAAANKESASTSTTTTASAMSSGGAMAGMDMGAGGSSAASHGSMKVATAGGVIKPVPTQVLGTTEWEGMKITAQAMTPVPFVVYNGTSSELMKPGKSSFHLMVMLNDAATDVPIPYATVWATISKDGKVISDERQWPMIARYMGPHYGNDVTLPGAGTYQLSLLLSPPVSARHLEYQDVWTQPHRVSFTFPWHPSS